MEARRGWKGGGEGDHGVGRYCAVVRCGEPRPWMKLMRFSNRIGRGGGNGSVANTMVGPAMDAECETRMHVNVNLDMDPRER